MVARRLRHRANITSTFFQNLVLAGYIDKPVVYIDIIILTQYSLMMYTSSVLYDSK